MDREPRLGVPVGCRGGGGKAHNGSEPAGQHDAVAGRYRSDDPIGHRCCPDDTGLANAPPTWAIALIAAAAFVLAVMQAKTHWLSYGLYLAPAIGLVAGLGAFTAYDWWWVGLLAVAGAVAGAGIGFGWMRPLLMIPLVATRIAMGIAATTPTAVPIAFRPIRSRLPTRIWRARGLQETRAPRVKMILERGR